MAARFEHEQSEKDGQWYWHLKDGNNEVIAHGEGYEDEFGVLRGIENIKTTVCEIVASESEPPEY